MDLVHQCALPRIEPAKDHGFEVDRHTLPDAAHRAFAGHGEIHQRVARRNGFRQRQVVFRPDRAVDPQRRESSLRSPRRATAAGRHATAAGLPRWRIASTRGAGHRGALPADAGRRLLNERRQRQLELEHLSAPCLCAPRLQLQPARTFRDRQQLQERCDPCADRLLPPVTVRRRPRSGRGARSPATAGHRL